MFVRPATHAGSWYTNDAGRLKSQLNKYFKEASELKEGINTNDDISKSIKGARILIGPHAGYAYLGSRLAETFNVWDTTNVKRVFILGPSHHVYFTRTAKLSNYHYYQTPFGDLKIDNEVNDHLVQLRNKDGLKIFDFMDEETDDDEHSFEMHIPFIYHRCQDLPQGLPQIIPIMIGQNDLTKLSEISNALKPFLADDSNTFVISSDFCHWGSRFQYTRYVDQDLSSTATQDIPLIKLGLTKPLKTFPIYKSIESLDKKAMQIASAGNVNDWIEYIAKTHNTICGQRPINVLLGLNLHEVSAGTNVFNWIGYSQSSQVTSPLDSSVSYASGYVKLK